MRTREEILKQATADLEAALGKTMLVTVLTGYSDKNDDSCEFYLKTPAKCRVLESSRKSLDHWNDGWLDPYWDLELIEPHAELSGHRSLWTFGSACYHMDGRIEPTTEFTIESQENRCSCGDYYCPECHKDEPVTAA